MKCDGSLVLGEIVGQQSLVVCGAPVTMVGLPPYRDGNGGRLGLEKMIVIYGCFQK